MDTFSIYEIWSTFQCPNGKSTGDSKKKFPRRCHRFFLCYDDGHYVNITHCAWWSFFSYFHEETNVYVFVVLIEQEMMPFWMLRTIFIWTTSCYLYIYIYTFCDWNRSTWELHRNKWKAVACSFISLAQSHSGEYLFEAIKDSIRAFFFFFPFWKCYPPSAKVSKTSSWWL